MQHPDQLDDDFAANECRPFDRKFRKERLCGQRLFGVIGHYMADEYVGV